jgi:hypothetical protein
MAESQKENQCTASVGSGWAAGGGGGGESSSIISDLTMPSTFQQQRIISRTSLLTGESPSSSNRKPPPESLMMAAKKRPRQQQQQSSPSHYETTSQSSGEKTREDVNIQYQSKKTPIVTKTNTTTTNSLYLRGEAKDDRELERALLASQQQYRDDEQKRIQDEQKRIQEEQVQLENAMRESLQQQPHPHRQQHEQQHEQQQQQQQPSVMDDEVILIDDNDDDLNTKISAKQQNLAGALEDKKMPANPNNDDQDEEDDIQKAIRLSLEEQNNKPTSNNDDGNDFHCRVLSRQEFEDVINPFVEMQGGFKKIENGKMVKMGNGVGEVKNGISQSRAQYGRYMMKHFWTVLDTLEGKIDTATMDNKDVKDQSCREIDAKQEEEAEQQQQMRPCSQLGSKITAFTDIGHGIGLQVMQAGWTLDVCSRGIELMKGRHEIAEAIREGVIDELRSDPPDSTKVELRLDNLVHCALPPPGQSKRDEELRRFVLFQDKPESIQRGLVIFANNAEDVFAARSNDSGNGACLDEHLAELFGNMKVGGKCVTLTDIRVHLTSNDDARWYHYESFDSGKGAVSWSPNKSVPVHVLTKISDEWICSNTVNPVRCPPSHVADVETGKLTTKCLYCSMAPRRQQQRKRKKRKIYSPEEGD